MGQVISLILTMLVVLGILYNVCAAILVARLGTRAVRIGDHTGDPSGVTILKPLCGDEPALAANLMSFFWQDYAGPIQIIFGVSTADDAALDAVETVRHNFPDVDCVVVIDPTRHGTNNKLSNLINMAAKIKHPLVIIADSDVDAPPDAVVAMARALADPKIGIASLLHVGRGDAGFWSRLAAMDISYRFMPSVVLGYRFNLAHPVLGPMMALRRETLAQIGGFDAFADVLADDYELGRAVRSLGLKLALPNRFITHGCSDASLGALVRHELRWTRTIYGIDPAGFAGSIVTHVLPNGLIAALLLGPTPPVFVLLGAAYSARILLKWAMDRASHAEAGSIILLPLRDLLSYALHLMTYFVGTVDWRGARFTVNADGKLNPARPK